MAKKILKTRVQFTSTMKKDLYASLQRLSKETQIPISRLLDKGATAVIGDYMYREYNPEEFEDND